MIDRIKHAPTSVIAIVIVAVVIGMVYTGKIESSEIGGLLTEIGAFLAATGLLLYKPKQ